MPTHESITLTGEIEDVFAHRFLLRAEGRRHLVDIGPKELDKIDLRKGETITVEGDVKPSEIKARKVVLADREVHLGPPHEHGPKHNGPKRHEPKHHDHDPRTALTAVRAAGYEVVAAPQSKPKHFEILARRAGSLQELHVDLDGHIRKTKPVTPDEPKWANLRA